MNESGKITHICAQYFKEELGFRIIEHNLGNNFTGSIDLLVTDTRKVYLVTINTSSLADALFKAFMGYRWYLENLDFLSRIYPSDDVVFDVPAELIILSKNFPLDTNTMLHNVCMVPVRLYKYMIFGSEDNPDIYIEALDPYYTEEKIKRQDFDGLRKDLNIEPAELSDDEIREFYAVLRV